MKKFNFFLLASFFVALTSWSYSCEGEDRELEETLEQLKQHIQKNQPFFEYEGFPDLPTEEDINQLEANLFHPEFKLPNSLKKYHLTLGNLMVGGVSFPTAHAIENEEKFRSELLSFIRDGWDEKGIPYKNGETWIPFGDEGGDYVCMNLQTGHVCYFRGISQLKKSKEEYPNLSAWLKKRFLSKQ